MEKEKKLTEKIAYTYPPKKIIPNPYDEIAFKKNGKYQFNFSDSKRWLEKQGKKQFGSHFKIYEEDHRLILTLLVYALGDEESAKQKHLNLKKGILLTGPIGCGKTSLMTLTNYFYPEKHQFQIKSTRDISFEFEKEGFKVINRYGKSFGLNTANNSKNRIFCFDDLGVEQTQKHYGNECNVMAEILLSRYDLFVSKGIPTHLTTNLSASELESIYGNRVRSRMREMFNLVAFNKNVRDKRV